MSSSRKRNPKEDFCQVLQRFYIPNKGAEDFLALGAFLGVSNRCTGLLLPCKAGGLGQQRFWTFQVCFWASSSLALLQQFVSLLMLLHVSKYYNSSGRYVRSKPHSWKCYLPWTIRLLLLLSLLLRGLQWALWVTGWGQDDYQQTRVPLKRPEPHGLTCSRPASANKS